MGIVIILFGINSPRNLLVIANEIKNKIILTNRVEIQVKNDRIVKALSDNLFHISSCIYIST